MLDSLLSKIQPAFGLDISAGSFKIMQLAKHGNSFSIKGYTDVALPKGLIVNDAVADAKTFDYMLKHALEHPQMGRIDSSYAVVSLPESKSFVRVIQIPVMSDAEADSAVPVEAESFIPMPVDQVYLDWQKLDIVGDRMNVLMIASPKDYVDKYLETLDRFGIKTVAMEVESQSCQRSVMAPGSKDTVLIVDLDAYRSSLIMIEDGNLQFTSTVPIAGNSFTESIAKILGVSFAKAEEIKKTVGISNTADYPNIKIALLPVLNSLSAEIKSILKFHNEHSGKPVSKILIAGGSAKLKNIVEFLSWDFSDFPDIKIELINPWAGIPGLQNPPLSPYDSLAVSTVAGLAVRGVNFIP